ncbi:hypothetical protein Gotri_002488 [Gossypium trilobum]|uniref:NB-ARC domain-containing protein n=1 Tax=Gossypium trilobum TaxID=34281 RepID=A0A7J9F8S2_9ROSI|nr:hypothetical protein [Gossypium trilobum]
MAAREPFLVGLLQFLLNSLASGELMDFRFHGGIQENLNKWRKMLGSPLETMVLGGLLNFEERDEWENILNGNLWSLHGEEDADIVPVLRLSYHYLPSHLKRCFAYYSILKKYELEKIELILLWMVEEDLRFTLQCNDKHSKESSNARH